VPTAAQLSIAIRVWFNDLLLEQGREEIESWHRNVRNWRRYNRTVTVGPPDARGCRRVTIEWDEDYEFEYVIVIVRKPSGLGWGQSFSLGGRTTHHIGWFEVKGEHHRESAIECPGDLGLASLPVKPSTVSMNREVIWEGREAAVVSIATGGEAMPVLTGAEGHVAAFAKWLEAGAPARGARPKAPAATRVRRGARPRRRRG